MPLLEDGAEQLLSLLKGVTDAGVWDPDTKVWSGALSAFATRVLVLTMANGQVVTDQSAFPYEFASLGQWQATLTSAPVLVAAMGAIIEGIGFGVDNIDTTSDGFDLNATVTITNLTGTQVATLSAAGFIPQSGPGASGSIDWSGATLTPVVGSDITFDGTAVYSTAGGVFVASMLAATEWD